MIYSADFLFVLWFCAFCVALYLCLFHLTSVDRFLCAVVTGFFRVIEWALSIVAFVAIVVAVLFGAAACGVAALREGV
jgi:hypothetical protein